MNKDRWLGWLDSDEDREILLAAQKGLKKTWAWDCKDPGHYPMNTSSALETTRQLLLRTLPTKVSLKKFRTNRKPRRFAELVSEGLIAEIWESQNRGKYENALEIAASIIDGNATAGWRALQSIIRAIEQAYMADYLGWELLPKPKVNILHVGLKDIAVAAGLRDQTQEGFAEFLDALCPCGLKQHAGAVRQMSRRLKKLKLK